MRIKVKRLTKIYMKPVREKIIKNMTHKTGKTSMRIKQREWRERKSRSK